MLTEINVIYKCNVCGNVVEGLAAGGGTLVCCGEDMIELKENTVDASLEKHVPVVEAIQDGIRVKVGSVPHPMEDAHWITTIEVITKDGLVLRRNLKPGDAPVATFPVPVDSIDKVREYCNLHGLWIA